MKPDPAQNGSRRWPCAGWRRRPRPSAIAKAKQGTGRRTIGKADYQARGVLYLTIQEVLDHLPRAYTKVLYDTKCDLVYQHFYDAYVGHGKSVYAVN